MIPDSDYPITGCFRKRTLWTGLGKGSANGRQNDNHSRKYGHNIGYRPKPPLQAVDDLKVPTEPSKIDVSRPCDK